MYISSSAFAKEDFANLIFIYLFYLLSKRLKTPNDKYIIHIHHASTVHIYGINIY